MIVTIELLRKQAGMQDPKMVRRPEGPRINR